MVKIQAKPKQNKPKKEVLETEEFDSESVSDHAEMDTDEENESKAGDSEPEESEAQSDDEGKEALDLEASSTESDEEEEDEEEVEEDDEEVDDDDEKEVAEDVEEASDDDDDEEEEVDEDSEEVSADDEEEDAEDDEEENDDEDDEKEAVEGNEEKKVNDDTGRPPKRNARLPAEKIEQIKQQIIEGYEKRKGLGLYIRLPERIPSDDEEFEEKIKSLNSLIVKARKPRQRYARFCLVDFASREDRDKAFEQLSEESKDTKVIVSMPRYEDDATIQEIAEKKVKEIDDRREKKLLRTDTKHPKGGKYTSVLRVFNIPKSASLGQITELFPNAIDIQIKPSPARFDGACMAVVTFPSTFIASNNQRRFLKLGGNKLVIRFGSYDGFKKFKAKPHKGGAKPFVGKKQLSKGDDENDEVSEEKPQKPIVSKKRSISVNEEDEAPKQKQTKPLVGKKRLSNGDQKDETPKEKPQKPIVGKKKLSNENEVEKPPKPVVGKKSLSNGDQKDETPKEKQQKPNKKRLNSDQVETPSKPFVGKKSLSNGDGENQTPAKKSKLTVEKETVAKPAQKKQVEKETVARTPQKKQKQSLNGSVKEVKVTQDKEDTASANGKSPKKKGGEVFKQKTPGKNPFVKKQQSIRFN